LEQAEQQEHPAAAELAARAELVEHLLSEHIALQLEAVVASILPAAARVASGQVVI
jgi:hypothetical protein